MPSLSGASKRYRFVDLGRGSFVEDEEQVSCKETVEVRLLVFAFILLVFGLLQVMSGYFVAGDA